MTVDARRRTVQPDLFGVPPRDAPLGAVEAWAHAAGRWPLLGIDEAGRGPLAGPVVAAAVVLPRGPLPADLAILDDSKKLSAQQREALVPAIVRVAVAVGVARVEPDRIDAINILEATREAWIRATERALRRLGGAAHTVLVDGNLPLPDYRGEQFPLVKGDSRSLTIAAASVLAKVARDRLMTVLDGRYPAYGFARHKGYGTVEHRRALVAHGPCPAHRRSFRWTAP
ncbi:MAG: ribonuclease HII [Myxococcales bacterium]|nr:ribonuclease HII [Myxococcales bacterium]